MPEQQGQGNQAQQQRQQGGFNWRGLIFQLVLMYLVISYFRSPSPSNNVATTDPKSGKTLPPHMPIFRGDERLTLFVYASEDEKFEDFNNTDALIWHEKDIYFDWRPENERHKDIIIKPSQVSDFYGLPLAPVLNLTFPFCIYRMLSTTQLCMHTFILSKETIHQTHLQQTTESLLLSMAWKVSSHTLGIRNIYIFI